MTQSGFSVSSHRTNENSLWSLGAHYMIDYSNNYLTNIYSVSAMSQSLFEALGIE